MGVPNLIRETGQNLRAADTIVITAGSKDGPVLCLRENAKAGSEFCAPLDKGSQRPNFVPSPDCGALLENISDQPQLRCLDDTGCSWMSTVIKVIRYTGVWWESHLACSPSTLGS